jgi:hypothetical protein
MEKAQEKREMTSESVGLNDDLWLAVPVLSMGGKIIALHRRTRSCPAVNANRFDDTVLKGSIQSS